MEKIIKEVFEANLSLVKHNLVIFTWGNVSAIDREKGIVVIKPGGVSYETMKAEDMVILDLDGNKIGGKLKPSSDTKTHIELYKNFPDIGGVVHTHSTWATSFAQAGKSIPALGTTHADYFYGSIPCTRRLTEEEIKEDYEKNTGKVIVETFKNINPNEMPGVLVECHGPFAWGKDAFDAVHNAVVLEQVAKMACITGLVNNECTGVDKFLLDKHYLRKHGPNAYYGQK